MPYKLPPSPPRHWFWGHARDYARGPLDFITRAAREYGDVVRLQFPGLTAYLLSHPEQIEEVLRSSHQDYRKDQITRRLSLFLGEGLLTSEGDYWRRQRRLAQPAFQVQQIETYAGMMVESAQRTFLDWQEGQTRDVHEDLMQLTLSIVLKALCNVDTNHDQQALSPALTQVMQYFLNPAFSWARLPQWLPVPATRRFQRAVRQLDAFIYPIIRQRRIENENKGDLLSRLLLQRDDDGSQMTDRQLRDELVTLLLAGHETTALTMTYCLYLLSQHPKVEERLVAELDLVLSGRLPAFADLPRLRYADCVLKESMRLYPPAWALGREATEDCQLAGFHVPCGTQIWLGPWVVHRDSRWYDQPLAFRPERWQDDLARRLPRCAYFPFGDGPRICIGQQFALTEATLLLATIVPRFSLQHAPGHVVQPLPSITLRPKNGLRMIVHNRKS